MGRILIFLLIIFLIFTIAIINAIKNTNSSEKESKYNSEYWWYNKPHYYIMSNGEKFNIPDYITWDLWKKLDQESKNRICIQLENKILNSKENNISKSISIE